jgi:hypothetical protein
VLLALPGRPRARLRGPARPIRAPLQSGRHIGAPFSAAVGRSGNVTAYGPWEAQVSPDGKRIAYWRGVQRLDAPVGGVTPYDLEDQVVVSRSDRFTPDSTFGYQRS